MIGLGATELLSTMVSLVRDEYSIMVNGGANLCTQEYGGFSQLHIACFLNDFDMVKRFVCQGVCLSKLDPYGNTPLHYVACNHNLYNMYSTRKRTQDEIDKLNIIKYLQKLPGIDVTCINCYGMSAVDYAAISGYIQIVDTLTQTDTKKTSKIYYLSSLADYYTFNQPSEAYINIMDGVHNEGNEESDIDNRDIDNRDNLFSNLELWPLPNGFKTPKWETYMESDVKSLQKDCDEIRNCIDTSGEIERCEIYLAVKYVPRYLFPSVVIPIINQYYEHLDYLYESLLCLMNIEHDLFTRSIFSDFSNNTTDGQFESLNPQLGIAVLRTISNDGIVNVAFSNETYIAIFVKLMTIYGQNPSMINNNVDEACILIGRCLGRLTERFKPTDSGSNEGSEGFPLRLLVLGDNNEEFRDPIENDDEEEMPEGALPNNDNAWNSISQSLRQMSGIINPPLLIQALWDFLLRFSPSPEVFNLYIFNINVTFIISQLLTLLPPSNSLAVITINNPSCFYILLSRSVVQVFYCNYDDIPLEHVYIAIENSTKNLTQLLLAGINTCDNLTSLIIDHILCEMKDTRERYYTENNIQKGVRNLPPHFDYELQKQSDTFLSYMFIKMLVHICTTLRQYCKQQPPCGFELSKLLVYIRGIWSSDIQTTKYLYPLMILLFLMHRYNIVSRHHRWDDNNENSHMLNPELYKGVKKLFSTPLGLQEIIYLDSNLDLDDDDDILIAIQTTHVFICEGVSKCFSFSDQDYLAGTIYKEIYNEVDELTVWYGDGQNTKCWY